MGLTINTIETKIDPAKYRRLVAEALPKKIETDEEFDRIVARLEQLDRLPHPTAEQQTLVNLLALLVEDYDSRHHAIPAVSGAEALAYLMEEHGLKAADLAGIMPRSRVSEILAGKRGISREQAKLLGERFKVGAEVFL
ncbi:MAG: transcriptional regulator [Acidobacteria bacterium]|nr:transcriptional regulator [Acidobacteriota bacterium]